MSSPSEGPRRALGKGLSAMFPAKDRAAPPADEAQGPTLDTQVLIDRIDPNPLQPRKVFQAEALAELAQSIRANGIVQPLVVRRQGDRFQIVAGERRWRAAKLAGLVEVPVSIQQVPDERLLELTLIENIQREDLNPIETALAFQRLSSELGLSHEEIGQRTGKDRATITNLLRLLHLPPEVQQLVADRRLTAGHARSLLSLPNQTLQRQAAGKAVAQGWSVRETERQTKRMLEVRDHKPAGKPAIDPNVKAAIEEMQRALGTRVHLVESSKDRGRIEIEYYSREDLDRIYSVIVPDPEA